MNFFENLKEKEIITYLDSPTRQVLIEKAPFKVLLLFRVTAEIGFKDKLEEINSGVLNPGVYFMVRPVNTVEWFNASKQLPYFDQDLYEKRKKYKKRFFIIVDHAISGSIDNNLLQIGCWLSDSHIQICLDKNENRIYSKTNVTRYYF